MAIKSPGGSGGGGSGGGSVNTITSTGGTLTVTNPSGPTVNLEVVGVPIASLTDGVASGIATDVIAFEHLANSTTYKLTLAELFGFDSVKQPVNGVYTTNVATLSGVPAAGTPDGVTLTAGQVVLLTANGAQNGPWIVNAGAWTRPPWYTTGSVGQSYAGITTQALGGTTNGGTTWVMTTTGTVTIDTTATSWSRVPLASSGVAAGGVSTNVQYNLSGVVQGDAGFTYTSASRTLTLGDATAAGVMTSAATTGATNGLDLTFEGGAANGTGNGGRLLFYGGTPTAGNGGDVNFTGASGVGTNKNGGSVGMAGGAATGSGTGGAFNMKSGASTSGGGGNVNIASGGSTSGTPGSVQVSAGSTTTGPAGGNISFTAGNGSSATAGSTGGNIQLTMGLGYPGTNNPNDGTFLVVTAQGLAFEVDQNANVIVAPGLAGGGGGGALVDQGYYLKSPVPVTGATFTVPAFTGSAVFNPAGTLATQTFKLPPTPVDGQLFEISMTQTVTTATWQDGAGAANVLNPPANPVAAGGYGFRYIASLGKWLRRF